MLWIGLGVAGFVILLLVAALATGTRSDSTTELSGATSDSTTTPSTPAPLQEPAPLPTTAAPPTTQAPPPTAVATTTIAAPATTPPPTVNFVMPSLVGIDLQTAQDKIQEHGVFYSVSHDLLGSRNQVLDSNWQVCNQTPPAGTRIQGAAADWEGKINFGVVKRTEHCP